MSAFTEHQRMVLKHRIARAIRWRMSSITDRDYANSVADAVVSELELSGFSAAAQRRAIDKVIVNLEERSA